MALVDAVGTEHAVADERARIVCLVPSVTELLCELGLASQLVGRTGFCIHPREVVGTIPKVGGTKDVKIDRVRELAPTHVVVNVDENRRETVEELARLVPSVVVTHPLGPLDNIGLFRLLGGIFGRGDQAEALCDAFEREYRQLTGAEHPREQVLYLIWREPWMTVSRDTYIARTLALAGWETYPPVSEPRYPELELAAAAGHVDRVLLSSEPFRFREKHVGEVQGLVPGARVSLIDGEMTSWYGSRAIAGLRYLGAYARA
jgi:ABC-type Fe3+-hydroxamate transport system substrate-binding protein